MAFPSIRSQATDSATANETTHTISLPATVVAGDVICVVIRVTVAGAIGWPDSSWNELFDASDDASDDQMAAAWKLADGSEGGTTISVTSGNGKFTSIAISVQDTTNPFKYDSGSRKSPFLGTIGTGTSAAEPNPGNCNPAADTRDYLFWTFYGMEGEQTGITAYPANYTLNQSGIVTTGTSGVVTTNCTMASAARQLNASSDDAGAWDVTGTLDDWTAYTIAFSSEPVGAANAPTSLPVRLPHPIAVSTVIVDLLQSTLAPPPDDPRKQTDWPNPQLNKPPAITHLSNPTDSFLNSGLMGFNQYDWPNPIPPERLIVSLNTRPVSSDVVNYTSGHDAPIFSKPLLRQDWNQNLLESTLAPEQRPFFAIIGAKIFRGL